LPSWVLTNKIGNQVGRCRACEARHRLAMDLRTPSDRAAVEGRSRGREPTESGLSHRPQSRAAATANRHNVAAARLCECRGGMLPWARAHGYVPWPPERPSSTPQAECPLQLRHANGIGRMAASARLQRKAAQLPAAGAPSAVVTIGQAARRARLLPLFAGDACLPAIRASTATGTGGQRRLMHRPTATAPDESHRHLCTRSLQETSCAAFRTAERACYSSSHRRPCSVRNCALLRLARQLEVGLLRPGLGDVEGDL
jgi:hypothetical protein